MNPRIMLPSQQHNDATKSIYKTFSPLAPTELFLFHIAKIVQGEWKEKSLLNFLSRTAAYLIKR